MNHDTDADSSAKPVRASSGDRKRMMGSTATTSPSPSVVIATSEYVTASRNG